MLKKTGDNPLQNMLIAALELFMFNRSQDPPKKGATENHDQKKNASVLIFYTNDALDALISSLALYTGEFDCYQGADYFFLEARTILQKLRSIVRNESAPLSLQIFPCCRYPPVAEILLGDPKEIMAIVCALRMYLGHYPDTYSGATIWTDKAHLLLRTLSEKYQEIIQEFS
jgi:hypothetical protein